MWIAGDLSLPNIDWNLYASSSSFSVFRGQNILGIFFATALHIAKFTCKPLLE